MLTKDMFSKERVIFELKARTKGEVIDELIEVLDRDGKISDKDEFKKAVLSREALDSTAIGLGIAIPHGKSSAVKEASIVFGRSSKGIDYESIDGELSYLFFMIAVPLASDNLHLKALSDISRKLMHNDVREQIIKATSFEELISVFD